MHDKLKTFVKDFLYERYAPQHLDGVSVIQIEHGYVTYRSLGNGNLHAVDVYVVPEVRGGSSFKQLLEKTKQVARDTQHSHIVTTVATGTPNISHNVATLLHSGFVIHGITADGIVLTLEVN